MFCGLRYYPKVEDATADTEYGAECENDICCKCGASFPEHTHYKYSRHGRSDKAEHRLEYIEEVHPLYIVDCNCDHNGDEGSKNGDNMPCADYFLR